MNRTAREDLQEFWEVVIQRVQDCMSKPMYDTWIASTTVGGITKGNTFIIKAATEFAAGWITERYKHHFIAVLKELTGQDFKVQVTYEQTKVERGGSDCSLIEEAVMNTNDDCNKVKVKRASVGIPIITPSTSSIKLRKDNEKITRSLNLPLAQGMSHTEKRMYAEIEKIRKKRKRLKKWWCINE